MKMILIAMIVLAVTAGQAWSEETTKYYVDPKENPNAIMKIESIAPTHSIKIMNPEGQTATIDFSGDKVTFWGDLPMDEAAKLFFKAVGNLCKCVCN